MGGPKGKAPMSALPSDAQGEETLGPALIGVRVDAAALGKIQHLVAGKTSEHGASAIQAARFGRFPAGFSPSSSKLSSLG